MKIAGMKARAAMGVAILLSVAPGNCQPPSAQFLRSELANAQVRWLIGMEVENRDGAKLGVVKDFVVDFHNGRISYAILSTAGILGLRAQLTAVPPEALSPATVKQRMLAVDISKVRWSEAPRFHKRDLQMLAERTQEVQIRQFYGLPVSAREGSPRPKGQMVFATSVIGAKLAGRQGELLGKVSGLLLDLGGQRPVMAILSTAEPLMRKQSYAVPLRSLKLVGADKVQVDATPGMFEQARLLTPKVWESAVDIGNAIYRYE